MHIFTQFYTTNDEGLATFFPVQSVQWNLVTTDTMQWTYHGVYTSIGCRYVLNRA